MYSMSDHPGKLQGNMSEIVMVVEMLTACAKKCR